MSNGWSTPADLRAQLERLWSDGSLLREEGRFPLELKLRRPDSRALSERFEEVRSWMRSLEQEPGFEIDWAEVDHRVLGRNRIPRRVMVARQSDAIALIGRTEQAERFRQLASETMEKLPELREWVGRKPLAVLENAADWHRILEVLLWFRAHPRCGLYLRQLDIAGVDTKFIEQRKRLLAELLDATGAGAAAPAAGPRWFEERYGLSVKPVQVRFRVLDRRLAIQGLTDVAAPVEEMAKLETAARRVFITENELNGLCFPEVRDSLVIFGLGYGIEALSRMEWLRGRELLYWGDIDTHGFHMLDRLRASFPEARSFLMDRATLLEHNGLWVREEVQYKGLLTRLTAAESELYEDLQGVRLEQERIRFGWLMKGLGEYGA